MLWIGLCGVFVFHFFFTSVLAPKPVEPSSFGTLQLYEETEKKQNKTRKIEGDQMYGIAMPKASTMRSAACLYEWKCWCCCWLNIQRNANHKIECQSKCKKKLYDATYTQTKGEREIRKRAKRTTLSQIDKLKYHLKLMAQFSHAKTK